MGIAGFDRVLALFFTDPTSLRVFVDLMAADVDPSTVEGSFPSLRSADRAGSSKAGAFPHVLSERRIVRRFG